MFTSSDAATKASADGGNGIRPGAPAPVGIIEDRRRTPPPTSILDPLTIATAVWNSKRLIATTTVFGIGIAVVLALVTPKMYVATTQILVDPRDIKVVANEVTPNGLPSEATLALIESQTSVIMSSNILSRVIADADLADDPEFNGERRTGIASLLPASVLRLLEDEETDENEQQYRILARLRHALTVGRELKSFVINLSVDSEDPEKAARLANLTADVFIDEQGRVQSDTARRATTGLSARLSELRQSVVEAEGAVEEYKSRNALVGVGGRLVDDQYITRINDELARVRGDIPALRVKADSMRGASVEDVVRGTLPEELTSEALVRLRQSYSDLEQQEAILAARLGPRHPQRIASEGALTAARQAIASELSRIVSSAQTELARAEGTERDLSTQINELKDKQIETSGSFVKLRELEREVDASRAVYEAFLLRARETSEQESLNTANVRIISAATPPLDPAGTSRKIVVAAGGILGFGIGIALAVLFAVLKLVRAFFAGERRRDPAVRWAEPIGNSGALVPYGNSPFDVALSDPPGPHPSSGTEGLRPSVFENDRWEKPAVAPSAGAIEEEPRRAAGAMSGDQPAGPRSDVARSSSEDATSRPMPLAFQPPAPADTPNDRTNVAEPLAKPAPSASVGHTPEDVSHRRGFSETEATSPSPQSPLQGGGLPLAEAGRRPNERSSSESTSLRERVRALSAGGRPEGEDRRVEVDPEVAMLRDEIQTVKQTIAELRRRRSTVPKGA